jgi:ubiquinone/menaquinone biosynthesis C-methylase UbiE
VDSAHDRVAETKGGEFVSGLATQERQSHPFTDEANVSFPLPSQAACVSVQEGYERWARAYDETPNPLLALEERHLRSILPDVVGSDVLDLGCGTGRWLARLLARGARTVVGLDLSAAMLGVARGKAGISDHLVRGDGVQLPFRASVFDFALSSFALNHIKDLEAIAQELVRAMKLNGHLLICEMHPEAYAQGWRPGFRDVHSSAQIETVSHSAESVLSCFRSNGFALFRLHDLFFAEPERAIFLKAGRGEMFESASQVPAIQVYDFKKVEAAAES